LPAIYRDGGFEAARSTILRLWGKRVETVEADARDAKTTLQEHAQSLKQNPPSYREVSRSGPDHAPVFTIEVQLASGEAATATAGNKRNAEQAAAEGAFGKGKTMTTRAGFVALIGEPNAGKSTLLNRMVGAKVSIVTHKVQTDPRPYSWCCHVRRKPNCLRGHPRYFPPAPPP
jgi:ATPase subunit of ABC transporter with duplicated ATPase domains